jgi:hypothetical protein
MNPIHKATLLRIDRARWWALRTPAAVFYGALATHLVDVIDESVKTAETDGKRIVWNPAFVAGLTDEQLRARPPVAPAPDAAGQPRRRLRHQPDPARHPGDRDARRLPARPAL